MPRKTNTDRAGGRKSRGTKGGTMEVRTPRPKPKIDFTVDALDFKNVNLLKQFVTDAGRILPRKYTGLSAHYQRPLKPASKRARQVLLMKQAVACAGVRVRPGRCWIVLDAIYSRHG